MKIIHENNLDVLGREHDITEEFFDKLGLKKGVNNQIKITSKWVKASFYKSAWVDIDAWDDFSSAAGKVCKWSFENSPFVTIEDYSSWNFRWPKGIVYKNLPEGFSDTLAPDWVWTKPILIDTFWNLSWAAHDVVSMTWDDIARYWGIPLVFTSVLDVAWINDKTEKNYVEMIESLWELGKNSKFVILNGETAELPDCVSSSNSYAITKFNWAWVMSGKFHRDKMITWEKVSEWDYLVVLKQEGFRSNWLSAVREAFRLKYGENYYKDAPYSEIAQASAPSVSYADAIAEANGWYADDFVAPIEMTWIAHLSWGSFKWKLLEDMLGVNWLSAEFDNLYPIPKIAKKVATWSHKWKKPMWSGEELYSTFCSGQWMVVAVKTKDDAEKLINLMADKWIGAQIGGRVIGTKEWEDPSIEITNIR